LLADDIPVLNLAKLSRERMHLPHPVA